MAVLDPRLLPLLETLADTGADWLAFEIMDCVRRGKEQEEAEELLQAARERVRVHQPTNRLSADIPALPEPILGDDQIVWAADYVATRLNGILADLEAGYQLIEIIAGNTRDISSPPSPGLIKVTEATPITIALIEEGEPLIDRGSLAAARQGIESLKDALANWSLQARGKSIL